MVAYSAATSCSVASSSASVFRSYAASAASRSRPGDVVSRISTSRRTPSSVSGKPVESSGSITPAADGRSAHVDPATRALRNASRGAWTKGSVGARGAELIRHRRQRRQQTVPCRRTLGGAERRRDRIGQRGPGAGDAVVETQHPDPSAGEHLMHRGIVDRIRRRVRRRPQPVPSLDAFEMRVESLRRRKPAARRFRKAERAVQEASRPARIDDERAR